MHAPVLVYRLKTQDTGRSLYQNEYTVFRDTDEAVNHIRPPEDYPPYWVSPRDNHSYKTLKDDYGY